MKRQISTLFHLLILLALTACGIVPASPAAAIQPSRLPGPNEVKAFLVQLVDVEKRAPGIVVGMIADDPQERWVVGYGRLSVTDERVPDGDTVYEIGSITKVFTGTLLAQTMVRKTIPRLNTIILVLITHGLSPIMSLSGLFQGCSYIFSTLFNLESTFTHPGILLWQSI